MMRISGYQIHESIYESPRTSVYRGQRGHDGQAVILKVLNAEYPSPGERLRYQHEYEMTRSLNLAGVVTACCLESAQHCLAIVFEDFGGESLQSLLKKQCFSLQEMLTIAIRIADSLAQLHAANIIHKNINPSNIVINPTNRQLKLIDFGIATKLSREHPVIRHPKALEGTLAYMSPEQTGRMNRSLDYRTDLYSLGVTLYELLTGQLPFVSDDALELAHCHLAKMPAPPHEIIANCQLPIDNSQLTILSEIIMKLMAKNAEDRYQSAYGLKTDLEIAYDQISNLKFSHDRIQEAAYSLIPEKEKARGHLKIGRLLRKQIPQELQEERTAELTQSNKQLQQEIQERHHAEQAVRTSERQYRALAEHVADGIAILREGKFIFVNDALCSMLEYSVDRLLKIAPVELFRKQDRKAFLTWFHQLIQGGALSNLQAVCRSGNEREIWTEGRGRAIDWEGKAAILVTMRDITERKLHELEIEKRRKQLQQENIVLRSTMKERYKFGDIIGKSAAMQEVYELIAHASATDANVVIYGESGTGKELTAQTIHQLSERRAQNFVPVNCGAIPENLFESEFFGHCKGAFTDADRDKQGFFATAHNGTLFLDEVAELSPAMQVKLLRALENGEYIRLGDHSPRHADVRIVAATNKDLAEQLRKGAIRTDFFYRINVVTIALPPLRDRRGDIPLLIDHFLAHNEAGKSHPTLPGDVLESLYGYDWPGNIRELQNTLQRYLTMGRLDFVNAGFAASAKQDTLPGVEFEAQGPGLQQALESLEKQLILQALEEHHWHRGKTAASLGIPRRSLQRKMKKYGLM